jgi:hypothetical protein
MFRPTCATDSDYGSPAPTIVAGRIDIAHNAGGLLCVFLKLAYYGCVLDWSLLGQHNQCHSKDIIRRDSMFFPILPDMLPRLVAVQRFPHIEGILATGLVLAGGVVTVIIDDAAEDAVAHVAVHGDGGVVAGADVEVDEPGVGLVAGALELLREEAGVAEAAVLRGDGEDGDVAVPGEEVGGAGEVRWGGFEFAHYCCRRAGA